MNFYARLLFIILLLCFNTFHITAQQVLMQAWYWDYPKTAAGASWADTLRIKAGELSSSGFTHIWFPPHAIASSGTNSNGYDPSDLFIGNQVSGLGTRKALDKMLSAFTSQGIKPVADLIFNHRDGGKPEINPAVKDYINKFYTAAKEPYPSDRFRCILPLGGNSGNGAGTYYFKISSKTQDKRFFDFFYKVYTETKTKGYQNRPALHELEPNGGSDCGAAPNNIELGRDMIARIDGIGCKTDEFRLTLDSADFKAAGDTLLIYLSNTADPAHPGNGYGYSDHRIYGIYSSARNKDIIDDLSYQTYTSYASTTSGRGQMNYEFFKPNTSNVSSTFLNGDWDTMMFFYDYDQFQKRTKDSLISYVKWNWKELGIRGLRMDAVKHFTPAFVGDMLDSLHVSGMDPDMVVGEWFSSNEQELKNWVNDVLKEMEPATKAAVQPKVFDFALRDNLRKACDDNGFDVRNVFKGSLHDQAGLSGFNIVTFTNNHDFRDKDGNNSLIKKNPLLAYAYIFTNNQLGVPAVYYPDYYGYPLPTANLYGFHPQGLKPLQSDINLLIRTLNTYIQGSPEVDFLNRFSTPYSSSFISGASSKAMIYQLRGSAANGNRDVIVAINFGSSRLKVDQTINHRGGAISAGTRFTDVLAGSAFPYAVVSNQQQVYLELAPFSYSVWVQGEAPVLAADIAAFSVLKNNRRVDIKWTVANKNDYLRTELLRSKNGRDFEVIRSVNFRNSSSKNAITYRDRINPQDQPVLYRVKLVKKDNSSLFSEIRKVK
jgi:hypothetical protein